MGLQLDENNIPKHIAIIMDGNGRWAKKRFLTKSAGHKAGAIALKKLSKQAHELGIKYLTVYAFSTENWKRPKKEVEELMNLLRQYIKEYIDDAKNNDLKIKVIGDTKKLDQDLQDKIKTLEELTKNKNGISINIALNYGSRDEITRSVKDIIRDAKNGNINIENITEETIAKYLDTSNIPDPDLLIRTSGELRISNFLLWQIAYTELYFTDKLWPDFTIEDLVLAISSYQEKERRFGGRK